ncbi:hypothetical protein, partial [Salmonella enterica]
QNKKPTHFFDFTDVPEKGPFRCSSFREYKNVKMHRYRNKASRKGYPGWATQCVTQHSAVNSRSLLSEFLPCAAASHGLREERR